MNGGGSERGRHRIWNRLQALSGQHRARRRAWTHRPQDHDLSRSRTLNRLRHPGAPSEQLLISGSWVWAPHWVQRLGVILFFLIYFWDKERQSMSRGGAERGRHRIRSRLQAPSCQHRARRRAWTQRQRDHDLSQSRTLNRLSHPAARRKYS